MFKRLVRDCILIAGTSSMPALKDLVDLGKYPKFNALVAKVGAFPPIAKYVAKE